MSISVIERFDGDYWFLSNFADHPAAYNDSVYPTAEHAFAAAKTADPHWIEYLADAPTARQAKWIGRRVPLRRDWEQVKPAVMDEVVRSKFTRDDALAARLCATGDALLIEGNSWGDDYWGRIRPRGCRTLVGRNQLGRTLMGVRRELQGHPETRWYRAALTGHREQFIDAELWPWLRRELRDIIVKLRDQHGTAILGSGLATGSDTWWAQAGIDEGLEIWAYQPFPEQPYRWTPAQQRDHAVLCEHASRHVLVGDRHANRFFDLRNELVIRDADVVVAVHDPRKTSGGTVNALRDHCGGMPVITVDLHTRQRRFDASYDPSRLRRR